MTGKSIGHYHLVEKVGEGGMGVVYRATDVLLRRDVALKLLARELATDSQRMARLEREAQVLALLDHPNIASIYDLVDSDDGYALVMELIEGPTIADQLSSGPMPLEEILPIAIQMADALAAAHQKGIIHRDLKPANVKVARSGVVKILDFGLAKMVHPDRDDHPDEAITDEVTLAGTLPYMSPEQVRCELLDARTDVYSLGAVLYEMATGQRPFGDARGGRLVGDIQHEPLLPPRSINPGIPRRLEDIILKCQEKDPERRFASMQDVADALRALREQTRDERSLAVLYFENLGQGEEDRYLCNGITEDIIVELSRIGGISVLPRSSVVTFRDQTTTAVQAGHKLGVSHVLDGSLQRAGDRLRITVTLIETSSSRTVWAERYDREFEDVFAIQDEIAQCIASALRVVLTDAEKRAIAKVPTRQVEAYEYYLRGRQHFQSFRRKSIEHALTMFERAIAADPDYALAYAGLSGCYSYLYMFWVATEENQQGADEASGKAVALDPECAEAHVARGVAMSLRQKAVEAEREFQRAIELDPGLFEAYYFCARGHYARGNIDQAIRWFHRAHEVRPEDYQSPCLLGSALAGAGRMEESADAFRMTVHLARKRLELNPGETRALYFSAVSLVQLGREKESLELAERALAMDPDEPQVLYNVACVYALLGQIDRAIDCLENVMEHGDWWRRWTENDPDLASLRDQPRFQALLMG